MRYLIIFGVKDPVEENLKKALEIEKERRKKGEIWGEDSLIGGTHHILSSAYKGLHVVDTTEAKIAKYLEAYKNVFDIKISPIMHREEYQKAIQ
jgi:hypothetical protein